MTDTREKFLTIDELVVRLNEAGLRGSRTKVWRWRKLPNPVPHHRPDGRTVYFLWSEVFDWIKSGWFVQTPDGDGEDVA